MGNNSTPGFQRKLFYSEDFIETINTFDSMILKDEEITVGVKEHQLKKGIFSHGVRHIIQGYVDFNKKRIMQNDKTAKDTNSEESNV